MSRKGRKWGRDFNILVSCYVLVLISYDDSGCQSCQGTEGRFLRHISLLLTGKEKCLRVPIHIYMEGYSLIPFFLDHKKR